mmetsp:Transcript_29319/g.86727  ORF Transcript_29319/g.86727 Transcript_29319/m.86727 type:complete len:86 (-) Transcript_29319:2070-2327(-)
MVKDHAAFSKKGTSWHQGVVEGQKRLAILFQYLALEKPLKCLADASGIGMSTVPAVSMDGMDTLDSNMFVNKVIRPPEGLHCSMP